VEDEEEQYLFLLGLYGMKQLLEAATMAEACYISEHDKGRPTSTGEFGGRRGWRVRLTPTVATRVPRRSPILGGTLVKHVNFTVILFYNNFRGANIY
jgi:hypothetical protein